ncbi:tyrosine-type recombinase/integrase [Herbaspirillum sp. DW155]|uniref:tyrosine-type recombinase/integrase n=1 Tax=Herbaspirillum sp. DW155 TaxID=3095609 RepID=UPI00308E37A8|nr:tyrosine-type recombinase/integrase [Herbaspirillum sp. DW155]
MNRSRKTGKGLPRRVYIKHGAYYFVPTEPMLDPKDGKMKRWIPLAKVDEGEAAMLLALGNLLKDDALNVESMRYVCAEFKKHKLKRYTDETKATYGRYLDTIGHAFADFSARQVTTKSWAEFLRFHFSDRPNTAQKYTALARKLFKFVISELGLREDNPIDQIELDDYETERRLILPTHEQVQAIRQAGMMSKVRADTGKALPTASGPMFACLVDAAYLLWARAVDVRMLKESQIDGELGGYIRLQPSKTLKTSGKSVDILITPAIWDVIQRARAIKKEYKVHGKPLITGFLFPTRKGTPYGKNGLFSMWDRARDRLGIGKDSSPEERIQFRDLRALGATDAAKAGKKIDEIQARLTHTSSKTSEIYIKEVIAQVSDMNLPLPWDTK